MDDKAHVGFVNSHTKCNRCHNDINAFHKEVVLCLRACSTVKSGMIRRRLNLIGLQHLGQFLYFLTRKTVDNAALPLMLTNELDDLFIYIICLRAYFVIEISTVERAFELLGIRYTKALLDVGTHFVRGCCSQSNDRSSADLIDCWAYITILGTEIMSPF